MVSGSKRKIEISVAELLRMTSTKAIPAICSRMIGSLASLTLLTALTIPSDGISGASSCGSSICCMSCPS